MKEMNIFKMIGLVVLILYTGVNSRSVKADCSGDCRFELLIFPVLIAGADILTASTPYFVERDKYKYSYRKTYIIGLLYGIGGVFIIPIVYETLGIKTSDDDRVTVEFFAGAAGLLYGNYRGFQKSKRLKEGQIKKEITLGLKMDVIWLRYDYHF